ncbi:MAG: hypothetical protein AB1626_01515 [Candidatus Micrarchaeota archaeon]
MVYVNVDFEGVSKAILDGTIKRGYAKTKSEVLRLALLALNDKYGVIEAQEEVEDAKDVQRIDAEIAAGKQKWLSAKAFSRKTGVKL